MLANFIPSTSPATNRHKANICSRPWMSHDPTRRMITAPSGKSSTMTTPMIMPCAFWYMIIVLADVTPPDSTTPEFPSLLDSPVDVELVPEPVAAGVLPFVPLAGLEPEEEAAVTNGFVSDAMEAWERSKLNWR